MYGITVSYTVPKELHVDIDELINSIVEEYFSEKPKDFFSIQCIFGDNIDYFLEKYGIIEDASVLSESALNEIYDEFTNRLTELYPDDN